MACTTVITASNGYKLRPLKESDFNFYMEAWKDFPQGVQTYEMRLKRFSMALQLNEGYGTEALIKSGDVDTQRKSVAWAFVLEKADATAVAYMSCIFEYANELFAKFHLVHPDHRGVGHWTALTMMNVALANRLDITQAHSWFMQTNPVNSAAMADQKTKYDTAGLTTSGTAQTTVTLTERGEPVFNHAVENLTKNLGNIAAWNQYVANNTDWASITYTYSTT